MTTPTAISSTVRLGDLIDAIETAHSNVLEQVSGAVLSAEHLGEIADGLIGHFVDRARHSGASWTEIGKSMGVTKQAAQKRFAARSASGSAVPAADPQQGFAQFTDRARNAVVAAHNAATQAQHDRVTPVHLLIGLVADPDSIAGTALTAAGAVLPDLRNAAAATLPGASATAPALVPYDDGAKQVLEATFDHAQRLGHPTVGTEHLLLALAAHDQTSALLTTAGIDPDVAEQRVLAVLASAPNQPA